MVKDKRITRNVLVDVTAHLAAAISLLERTPRAKKAAPSDKMFDQMLTDYRNSLNPPKAPRKDKRVNGSKLTRAQITKRDDEMAALRSKKWTFRAIGKKFDLSPSRVSYILQVRERRALGAAHGEEDL